MRECNAKWNGMKGAKAWVLGVNNSDSRMKCFYVYEGRDLADVTGTAQNMCRDARWNKCFLMGQGDRKKKAYVTLLGQAVYTNTKYDEMKQAQRQQAQRQQQQRQYNANGDAAAAALLNGVLGGLAAGYATGSQPIQHSSPRPQPRAAPTHNGGSSDNCDWSTGACSSQ
jgi:hypothetical protein